MDTVWTAWTDTRHVAEWWGPRGATNPICELDVRPEGSAYIVSWGQDGVDYPVRATYTKIIAQEVLEMILYPEDGKGTAIAKETLQVSFAQEGAKTKLSLRVNAEAIGANEIATLDGIEAHWNQAVENLSGFLPYVA